MKKRIFLAVVPSREVVSSLKSCYIRSLPVRWTKLENLHATINFLGEVDELQLNEIFRLTEAICKQHPIIKIRLNKIVVHRNMIWATIKLNTSLENLHIDLKRGLVEHQIPQQDRRFRPHINLARAQNVLDTNLFKFRSLSNLNFDATHLVVFESILKPQGPVYISLDAFELSKTNEPTTQSKPAW